MHPEPDATRAGRMHALLAAALCALAGTAAAQSGLDANCTLRCAFKDGPSGSICAAPAYVHVDCIGDGTNETRSGDANIRPFHDLGYRIDYGDSACASGQGTWANGALGASKNVDYTPLGAHVYECPGTFTVRTTVTNSLGQTDSTGTEDRITVIPEDEGWPDAVTKCVCSGAGCANGGPGFLGCPLDNNGDGDCTDTGIGERPAQCVAATTVDESLRGLWLQGGHRTLFRRGDTFPVLANPQLQDATKNGSLIGAYGPGTRPAFITHTGPASIFSEIEASYDPARTRTGESLSGWRFRDLHYTNTGGNSDTRFIWSDQNPGAPYVHDTWGVLELRITKRGVGNCDTHYKEWDKAGWNELAASVSVDCELSTRTVPSWAVQYGLGYKYGATIDNRFTITNATAGVLPQRIMGVDHTFFAHNTQDCAGTTSFCAIQFRAAEGTRHTQYVVVHDQLVLDGSNEYSNYFDTSPRHGESGTFDTDYHDFLVDGFVVMVTARKPAAFEVNFPFRFHTHQATLRNSILDTRAHPPTAHNNHFVFHARVGDASPPPVGVSYYNNLVLRSGSAESSALGLCEVTSGPTHVRCRNNVIWLDGNSDESALTTGFGCTGCAQSNNLRLYQDSGDCPFFGATGTCDLSRAGVGFPVRELRLRSSGGNVGALVDRGFAFPETSGSRSWVPRDFLLGRRGAGAGAGAVDIGPSERGSTP